MHKKIVVRPEKNDNYFDWMSFYIYTPNQCYGLVLS